MIILQQYSALYYCTRLKFNFDSDIHVLQDEFNVLKRDLTQILKNKNIVAKETCVEEERIEFWVGNALEILRVAEKYPDKVGVYVG